MSQLVRLVYVSRTNNPSTDTPGGVPLDIGRILMQSRRNNPPREIGGVLYFRDELFFQCLEGARDEVEALYEKIAADPRHRDVVRILEREVGDRKFEDWSMKYVALDEHVDRVLADRGLSTFDPYHFDEATTEAMLDVFVRAEDSPIVDAPAQGEAGTQAPRPGFLARLFGRG